MQESARLCPSLSYFGPFLGLRVRVRFTARVRVTVTVRVSKRVRG